MVEREVVFYPEAIEPQGLIDNYLAAQRAHSEALKKRGWVRYHLKDGKATDDDLRIVDHRISDLEGEILAQIDELKEAGLWPLSQEKIGEIKTDQKTLDLEDQKDRAA